MKNLLLAIGLLLPLSALAQDNLIDGALESCLNKASSTVEMSQCYVIATQAWDKEMNQQYSRVMSRLTSDQKAKLRDAQRNWLKYRDSWLEAAKAWYLKDQGSMATLSVGAQSVEIVKNQTLMLKSLKEGSCTNPDDCQ